jgi:RNA polymerase sigma-70 factor (ECF subfamily)
MASDNDDRGGDTGNHEFKPGNRADFERLYQSSYPKIVATLTLTLGNRTAAEDCTQDAFRRAWTAWPRWKSDAPAEAWIYRIAVRVASNYRAKERLRTIGETLRRLGRPGEETDPSDVVVAGDLQRALASLPVSHSTVIVLRHLHGYSNREIGVALGLPEGTVASRLLHARQKLRQKLGPDWNPRVNTLAPSPVVEGDESR